MEHGVSFARLKAAPAGAAHLPGVRPVHRSRRAQGVSLGAHPRLRTLALTGRVNCAAHTTGPRRQGQIVPAKDWLNVARHHAAIARAARRACRLHQLQHSLVCSVILECPVRIPLVAERAVDVAVFLVAVHAAPVVRVVLPAAVQHHTAHSSRQSHTRAATHSCGSTQHSWAHSPSPTPPMANSKVPRGSARFTHLRTLSVQ